MGGICGWIGTEPAGGGAPPSVREAMTGALAHRGGVAWLAGPAGDEAAIVADGAGERAGGLRAAWADGSGDPALFCSRLEGAFAVAVLDGRGGRLVLARDRLGERPLYYTVTPAGVAFASEIKALFAARLIERPSLRPEALDAYLAFTYIPAPWTIYRQIWKVPAGHYVELPLRAPAAPPPRAERYWSLPERGKDTASPDRMLEMLDEAVGRRLPADGRTACLLSGGLDSSVVAALLSRRLKGTGARLPTFSAGFSDTRLDESAHARRVAGLIGSDHHEILLRDIDPETATRVILQLDEPMADAACLPTWVLAREAAAAAPVVMTGDGADALLAGDHWFRRLATLDRLERLPRSMRLLLPAAGALTGPKRFRRYRDLVTLLDRPPVDRYLSIRLKWTRQERLAVYSGEFSRVVDPALAEATYAGAGVDWRAGESVDAGVRLDSVHGLPEDLLMKADKMCGAHGIESRSPFLDRTFVEWAARLDIGLLLRGSDSKHLLKKAAGRLLPRDLVYRRKHGLQTPIGRWLKGSLRDLTRAAFDPALIAEQGIFSAPGLGRLEKAFLDGDPSPALAGKVWQIVAFQVWWRHAPR